MNAMAWMIVSTVAKRDIEKWSVSHGGHRKCGARCRWRRYPWRAERHATPRAAKPVIRPMSTQRLTEGGGTTAEACTERVGPPTGTRMVNWYGRSEGLPPEEWTWCAVTLTTTVTADAVPEFGRMMLWLSEPEGPMAGRPEAAVAVGDEPLSAVAATCSATSSWSHGSSTVRFTMIEPPTRAAEAEPSTAWNPASAWQRSHVSGPRPTAALARLRADPGPCAIARTAPS